MKLASKAYDLCVGLCPRTWEAGDLGPNAALLLYVAAGPSQILQGVVVTSMMAGYGATFVKDLLVSESAVSKDTLDMESQAIPSDHVMQEPDLANDIDNEPSLDRDQDNRPSI